MPKVLNKHKDKISQDDVYVGRPTIYGNPFIIGTHGNRDKVVQLYEDFVMHDEEFKQYIKETLKGKNLICFCAPLKCHADVLLKIANE